MLLVAESIEIDRGGRPIVRDLSFRVGRGECLVVTGPNGAGKTSLLRALAGLLPLAGGRVSLRGDAEDDGVPDGEFDQDAAQSCHYIGHLNAVKANMTVAENLAFWAAYLSPNGTAGRATTVAQALVLVKLKGLADIPASVLSAGQKRRLGLARLFAAPRPIWLLDEPTASLDAGSAADLAQLIDRHTEQGGLAIVATHLPLGLARSNELALGTMVA